MKDIFERHPKLQSVSWRQYTPYFNDGDECVFHTHIDTYSLNVNGCCPDYGDDEYEEGQELTKPEHDEIADEVCDFLNQIDDEDFKHIYGDHVRVTLHRDGTSETDEYSHD
jgi:hypothetical protein